MHKTLGVLNLVICVTRIPITQRDPSYDLCLSCLRDKKGKPSPILRNSAAFPLVVVNIGNLPSFVFDLIIHSTV